MTNSEITDHDRLVEIHILLGQNVIPKIQDHDMRIRKLERALWIMIGAAVMIGSTVGTTVGSLIGKGGIGNG